MMGRPETADEAGSMSVAYQKAATTTGFSVRDLMTTLVTSVTYV